jgi:hypothetical protein
MSPVAEYPTATRERFPWREVAGAAVVAAGELGRLAVRAAVVVVAVACCGVAFLLGCCL